MRNLKCGKKSNVLVICWSPEYREILRGAFVAASARAAGVPEENVYKYAHCAQCSLTSGRVINSETVDLN